MASALGLEGLHQDQSQSEDGAKRKLFLCPVTLNTLQFMRVLGKLSVGIMGCWLSLPLPVSLLLSLNHN